MSARDELARLLEQVEPGPWRRTRFGNEPPLPEEANLIVWLRNHADRLLALWEEAQRHEYPSHDRAACRLCAALAALESTEGT